MNDALIKLERAEQDSRSLWLKFTLGDMNRIKIDLLKVKLKKGYIKLELTNNHKTMKTCLRLYKNIEKRTVKVTKAERGINIFVQKSNEEIWPYLDNIKKTPLVLKGSGAGQTTENREKKNSKKIKKKFSVENFVKKNLKNMISQTLDNRSKTLSASRRGKRRRRSRCERSSKSIRNRFSNKENKKHLESNSRSKAILFKKRVNLSSEIPILQTKLKNILSSKEEVGLETPMLSSNFNRGCLSARDLSYKKKKQVNWSKVKKILSIKNFPFEIEKIDKLQKLSFLKIFVKELKSNLVQEQSMRMKKERELEGRLIQDYIKVSKLEEKIEDRCKKKSRNVRFDGVNFTKLEE